jgi:hypothetical protein
MKGRGLAVMNPSATNELYLRGRDINDDVFMKRGGKRVKSIKNIKKEKKVSQSQANKQNVHVHINIGDKQKSEKPKQTADDSVKLERSVKPKNNKANVGNVTRHSTPAFNMAIAPPIMTIYNDNTRAPMRSDFPGFGVYPNVNQRRIGIEDNNINQPQIQPVNPNDITQSIPGVRAIPTPKIHPTFNIIGNVNPDRELLVGAPEYFTMAGNPPHMHSAGNDMYPRTSESSSGRIFDARNDVELFALDRARELEISGYPHHTGPSVLPEMSPSYSEIDSGYDELLSPESEPGISMLSSSAAIPSKRRVSELSSEELEIRRLQRQVQQQKYRAKKKFHKF